jgi:hypothetical protein
LIRHTTVPGYRCGLTTVATALRADIAEVGSPDAHEVVLEEP